MSDSGWVTEPGWRFMWDRGGWLDFASHVCKKNQAPVRATEEDGWFICPRCGEKIDRASIKSEFFEREYPGSRVSLQKKIAEIPGPYKWQGGEETFLQHARRLIKHGFSEEQIINWLHELYWAVASEWE